MVCSCELDNEEGGVAESQVTMPCSPTVHEWIAVSRKRQTHQSQLCINVFRALAKRQNAYSTSAVLSVCAKVVIPWNQLTVTLKQSHLQLLSLLTTDRNTDNPTHDQFLYSDPTKVIQSHLGLIKREIKH